MNTLIALLPPLFLGPIGVVMVLVGGSVKQQLVGETAGAAVLGLAMLPWASNPGAAMIALAFCSGVVCALGLAGQIHSFTMIGVSTTMAISTGLQLLFMALVGVIVFHEWKTPTAVTLGLLAVAAIALGTALTSYHERSDSPAVGGGTMMRAIALNIVSAAFLAAYIVMIRLAGLNFIEYFPAQSMGVLAGAVAIALLWREGTRITDPVVLRLAATVGVLFGAGLALVQVSAQVAGVATGFTLSQLGVIISVASGIIILKETRTSKEMTATWAGVALILIGAVVIGYTKTL